MNQFFIILLLFLCSISRTEGQAFTQTDSLEKPKGVLDLPVEFSGWQGNSQSAKSISEIRIGLFFPADSLDKSGQPLIMAARLAIDEINVSGGYNSIPFRLINRWSSDPWGAGSKEMIKLVYQDSVWAVIGAIDGDATHIAEQIVTKAWLPLLSPISADPTLTYIRIPWIFRLPPDYKAQSEVIIHEGIKSGRMENIGLITENSHDGRIFVEELNDVLSNNNISPRFHFEVSKSDLDIQSIVQRIISFNPSSIIICLSNDNIVKLLSELGTYNQQIDVSLPWIPGLDYDILVQYYKGEIYLVEPFLRSPNPAYKEFATRYYKHYGSKPTFGAAYTYDAVHILTRALQKSGLNRAGLRDVIGGMKEFHGVTGKIFWDNGGGNLARPILRKLKVK